MLSMRASVRREDQLALSCGPLLWWSKLWPSLQDTEMLPCAQVSGKIVVHSHDTFTLVSREDLITRDCCTSNFPGFVHLRKSVFVEMEMLLALCSLSAYCVTGITTIVIFHLFWCIEFCAKKKILSSFYRLGDWDFKRLRNLAKAT